MFFSFWNSAPPIGPCPAGYTLIDGHVNQLAGQFKHINATFKECEELCKNDPKCVSFEFCHYKCDDQFGPPYKNKCIINYKNFPQGDMPRNFFRCSKGKEISKINSLFLCKID